jgi:hypothetical protein
LLEDPGVLGRRPEQAALADGSNEGALVLCGDDRNLGDAVLLHQSQHPPHLIVA